MLGTIFGTGLTFLVPVTPTLMKLRKRSLPGTCAASSRRAGAVRAQVERSSPEAEAVQLPDRSAEKIQKHRLGAKKHAVAYYLVKSEGSGPRKFTIDDLAASPLRCTSWDGVRNFQARNVLLSMQLGDFALFYHSNCKQAGIVGIVEIVREAYVDQTQFDSTDSEAYDPRATPDKPRWYAVDVKLQLKLPRPIPFEELKQYATPGGPLDGMVLFSQARLSVQPVRPEHFRFILGLF
jgi:predicted RNA-binding protein with PUA-like domain